MRFALFVVALIGGQGYCRKVFAAVIKKNEHGVFKKY
jgi:hypothetical protein